MMKKLLAVCTTALLAVGLAVTGAVGAQAAEITATATAQDYTCSSGELVQGSITLGPEVNFEWEVALDQDYNGETANVFFDADANTFPTNWGGTNYDGVVTVRATANQGDEFAPSADYTLNDDGTVATWQFTFEPLDCSAQMDFDTCEGSTTLPTSTNLNKQGWVMENGEYVEGGVKLGSPTEDSYIYMTLPVPVTLSALAPLGFTSTGQYGAILVYNDDYSVNVHYEPIYADPLWTESTGILPSHSTGDGTYGGNFSDLISNPLVTEIAFWVNPGHEVTLSDLTFNCMTQPFGLAAAAVDPDTGGAELADTGVDATGYIIGGSLFLGAGVLTLLLGAAYRRKFTTM